MNDLEFLADLAEVQVSHSTEEYKSLECIINMYYMIAVLRDDEHIVGFRLYDMRYNFAADYSYASVEQRVREKSVHIANMAWLIDKDGARLACTQGEFTDYTQLSSDGQPLSYYRPLVCIGMYGRFLFVDYLGGVLQEDINPPGKYSICSCAGVANLCIDFNYDKTGVPKDKIPRSKHTGKSYYDMGLYRAQEGRETFELYAEDIYLSDQSCCDTSKSRTVRLKTLVYGDTQHFIDGTVALSSRGITEPYNNTNKSTVCDEPWFLTPLGNLVNSSGEPVDSGRESLNGRILACYPTFCYALSELFILKKVPMAILQDLTAWENFASLTQLEENCQCTYVPSEGLFNPTLYRNLAVGETSIATVPNGLTKVLVSKTIVPAGSPPVCIMMRGTNIDIDTHDDFDWVLNFEATSAQMNVRSGVDKTVRHLKGVYISGKLEMVQNYAFARSYGIKEVELPDSVYLFGMHCFEDCVALEKINFPTSLRGIGVAAFCRCSQLQTVNLPDGLLVIGAHAFAGCIAIKTLIIPESVKVIHRKAFADCSGITNLVIKGSPKIEVTAFSGCNPAVVSVASEYESFNELKETAKKLRAS